MKRSIKKAVEDIEKDVMGVEEAQKRKQKEQLYSLLSPKEKKLLEWERISGLLKDMTKLMRKRPDDPHIKEMYSRLNKLMRYIEPPDFDSMKDMKLHPMDPVEIHDIGPVEIPVLEPVTFDKIPMIEKNEHIAKRPPEKRPVTKKQEQKKPAKYTKVYSDVSMEEKLHAQAEAEAQAKALYGTLSR